MTITGTSFGGNTVNGSPGNLNPGSLASVAGDRVIVVYGFNDGTAATTQAAGTVTSTPAKTFTKDTELLGANNYGFAVYSWVSDGTTLTQITVTPTFTGSAFNVVGGIVLAHSDVGTVTYDATTKGTGTDATSPLTWSAGGAIAGTSIGLLAVFVNNGASGTFTTSTGYTDMNNFGDGSTAFANLESFKVNETGTPSLSVAYSAAITDALELFVSFKEPTAAPSGQARDRDRRTFQRIRDRWATRDRGRQRRSQFDLYHAATTAVTATTANAVAASVAATATNPVANGTGTASAVAATVTATASNPVAAPTTYLFDDEFPGSSVDSSKWLIYNRLGDQANSELQAMVTANARVSSGSLFIDSKFEDVVAGDTTTGAPNPRTVHYSSGQVAEIGSFQYGSVQVRAKICGGTGTWPCIWMLGVGWQPSQPFTADDPTASAIAPGGNCWEIDIAEFLNGHRTLQNCALHFITNNRGGSGEKTIPYDATTRFMVYRMDWTATSVTWLIDPEDGSGFQTLLTFTGTPGTDIPNTAGYLMISTAVGGFGGTPNSATFPVSTEVDWVRITPDPSTGYPPGAAVTATASNPVATGTGRASAVAATVTASASNPAASGTATASAVAATVTVSATDPVAHGAGTASPPAALVTVTANNPAAGGTAQANAVAASVTVTASNPAGSGTALASPVAALVAVTAADPTGTGTATASAVNALVAVTATNPVAQTAGDGLAHPVAASVTVTATDPTFTVSSTAAAVMALVTVTATDPAVSGTGTASAVFALVAVTASNPVASGQGNAQANVVAALVVVTATDPGASGAGTATPSFAAITAGATNPTVNLTATATVLAALVIVTATNPGTSGGASTFFFGVRRTVRRDPIRRSVQIDPLRRSKKVP